VNFLPQRRRGAEGEGRAPLLEHPLRGQPPAGGYPSRPQMEVIFCCFSERDAAVYEMLTLQEDCYVKG
jgi:hypothetical protein